MGHTNDEADRQMAEELDRVLSSLPLDKDRRLAMLNIVVREHVADGWSVQPIWGFSATLTRVRRAGLFGKQMVDTLVLAVDNYGNVTRESESSQSLAEKRAIERHVPRLR